MKNIIMFLLLIEEAETDLIIFLIELVNDLNLSNFNPDNEGALAIFIHKFLSNTFKNLCKKNKRRNKVAVEIDYSIISDNSIISFDSEIFISMLLDSLPQLQKQIIYKKYIQGYSDREISIILNISR
ncbi:RNA polymerase sigma factor [Maledivibacter halophilus]|uniref:RNA polymerase sigma factor n=1 Tax=Maledivibacter halophilus TaxID=36842 RepID=UPI0011172D1C|nr:sigma factor-like helix-turn-helix DNA-binding protein [Maledivibacter halophilus]